MTIPFSCVLITACMPYLWTAIAKFSNSNYDNRNPRLFLDGLKGYAQRAHWAQMNAFEAFPIFAAAVIIANAIGTINIVTLNILSVSFVVFRLSHGLFYILDKPNLRSMAWLLATLCWVAMFMLSM